MAFQPVVDTVEVVIDYLQSGVPAANVLHFYKVGGYTQGDLDNIAAGTDSEVAAWMLPFLATTQEYVQTRVRGLGVDGDIAASNGDSAGVGALTTAALPNNVSLCLTLRTAFTGRSFRGRLYGMAPNVAHMSAPNLVSTTYRGLLLAATENIILGGTTNGFTHVVVSRFHNKVQRAAGVVTPVTNIVARNLRTDSQRGRMGTPS